VIGVGLGLFNSALRGPLGWPDPVLLTTLSPTGAPTLRLYTAGYGGTYTFDDGTAAKLTDADDGTFAFLKLTCNSGGSGTYYRLVSYPFTTCPDYAHISHLVCRTYVKRIQAGSDSYMAKRYMGVHSYPWSTNPADRASVPTNILPGTSLAWQEYLWSLGRDRAPWTTAGVNAQEYGWDVDLALGSGPPGLSIEFQIAAMELQVWGTA
jgi:hypothetical protein